MVSAKKQQHVEEIERKERKNCKGMTGSFWPPATQLRGKVVNVVVDVDVIDVVLADVLKRKKLSERR